MAEATDTDYLSIGEVLGLLLEEFPDVTISKIRFLESQGLIDPERTPSGYRKFYDADVELLRVILREQRENYLPLRVIKDRLDSGAIDPSGELAKPDENHRAEPGEQRTEASTGSESSVELDASRHHDDADHVAGPGDDHQVGHGAPDDETPDDRDTSAGLDQAPDDEAPDDQTSDDETSDDETSDDEAPDDETPDVEVPPSVVAGHPAARRAGPEPDHTPVAPQLLPGVVLDRDELCAMVGLAPAELAQLETYGIVTGRGTGGATVFGDDAVEIAKLSVQFLRAGVDARHLRGWRTAAEREASLYEQLITPRLRQRNPEARAEALDALRRLEALGGKLRTALMRTALRHHLDS